MVYIVLWYVVRCKQRCVFYEQGSFRIRLSLFVSLGFLSCTLFFYGIRRGMSLRNRSLIKSMNFVFIGLFWYILFFCTSYLYALRCKQRCVFFGEDSFRIHRFLILTQSISLSLYLSLSLSLIHVSVCAVSLSMFNYVTKFQTECCSVV